VAKTHPLSSIARPLLTFSPDGQINLLNVIILVWSAKQHLTNEMTFI